jgi:uncharacterized membrane protein
MFQTVLCIATLVAALGCGLIAGVFFAFSAFVMKALARLPAAQGIAAMQSINVAVITPWFLSVFLGTAAACIGLAIAALSNWQEPGAACLLTGSLLYVVGTFGVTMACNVPLNDALAAVDASSDDGAKVWRRYVSRWTAWNHVRTLAAFAATLLLTTALV